MALLGWVVFSLFIPEYYLPVLPYTLLFVVAITLGVHAYQLMLVKKDMARFARSNMLVTFFKLMVYSLAAIIYIASDRENAVIFVICLMVLYLIYTFFEVTEMSKIVRKKGK